MSLFSTVNSHNSHNKRRKKGSHIFLVAFYECDDGFELENINIDRMYCSQETWVGDTPNCMSIGGEEGELKY